MSFDDFGELEATLGVNQVSYADRFVYGAVGRSAVAVRVRLDARADRGRSRAIFVLVLPRRGPDVTGVRAVDALGRTVGRERLGF